jgi:hypothetical protein
VCTSGGEQAAVVQRYSNLCGSMRDEVVFLIGDFQDWPEECGAQMVQWLGARFASTRDRRHARCYIDELLS